jgi:hypothetical protein
VAGRLTRFLGDSPLRVAFKLIVLSFVVGLVLATLDIHPLELWAWAERLVMRVWHMGFEALERAAAYLILGALIVVPLFLIVRLVKFSGRRGE